MKSEILLINGSPRKKGNTSSLLEEMGRTLDLVDDAKPAVGRHNNRGNRNDRHPGVQIIHLDSLRIAPCKGCLWCQGSDKRLCVRKDDMGPIYKKLLSCEALVLGSPVYWDGVTAQLKIFIDRLFALMKWRGDKCKSLLSGRKAAIVLVAGGGVKDGLGDSRKMLRTVIKWCGFKFAGQLIVPYVDKPGEVQDKPEMMEKARRLVKKLRSMKSKV